MIETTKVQFPRFEYEIDHDKPNYPGDKKLIRRTHLRPWLLDVEVQQVIEPRTIVATSKKPINMRKKTNWYGVYHKAVYKVGVADFFDSPFTGQTELSRLTVIEHDYLWDQQAIEGRATEVVLETFTTGAAGFEERAALLVPRSFRSRPGQELVIRDDSGEWKEPAYGTPDNQRDFCLMVMSELAIRELAASDKSAVIVAATQR